MFLLVCDVLRTARPQTKENKKSGYDVEQGGRDDGDGCAGHAEQYTVGMSVQNGDKVK